MAECESARMSVFERAFVRVCVGEGLCVLCVCVCVCVCVCACVGVCVCASAEEEERKEGVWEGEGRSSGVGEVKKSYVLLGVAGGNREKEKYKRG